MAICFLIFMLLYNTLIHVCNINQNLEKYLATLVYFDSCYMCLVSMFPANTTAAATLFKITGIILHSHA